MAPVNGEAGRVATITVSVASHGHGVLVTELLRQLAVLDHPGVVRVVVVHNLPAADVAVPPGARFDVVQLHNTRPLGFAANHNLAFSHCTTHWFAVLNPDLEFSCGNPFPPLLDAAATDSGLGAVAPVLLDPGTRAPAPARALVTPLELLRRRLPGWAPPQQPQWLVGAFVLVRAKAFRDVGGFDARYRLYCEDVDFGLRLQLAGWRIHRVAQARVVHDKQQASHRQLRYLWWHLTGLARLWTSAAFARFLLRR